MKSRLILGAIALSMTLPAMTLPGFAADMPMASPPPPPPPVVDPITGILGPILAPVGTVVDGVTQPITTLLAPPPPPPPMKRHRRHRHHRAM